MTIKWNNGSYRDPVNRVFEFNGEIYRAIYNFGEKNYLNIKKSGIIEELVSKDFIVDTEEVSKDNSVFNESELSNAKFILKHKKIPFVSYPYEWCFEQLKKAAIFHLDLQIFLLKKHFILKDASAFNIQFIGNQPIFIDLTSIEPYVDGEYWKGYKQFCENFLNPLLLTSKKKVPFNYFFRSNLEGISSKYLTNLLSLKDKFSLNIITHVILQAKYEDKVINNEKDIIEKYKKLKKLPKKNYMSILLMLKNWIKKMEIKKNKSTWSEYAKKNTYKDSEKNKKAEIVEKFVKKFKPKTLIDLGCNTGDYSIAGLNGGADYAIGFDYDFESINKACNRSKQFLPLWLDAANPSPGQGFNELERDSFSSRAKSDALIALAFIHHMIIAKNISLKMFINWIASISKVGLLEFVPKNDETVEKMLLSKKDIYPDYNFDNLINELNKKHQINNIINVSDSGRKIIEYQSK